MTAAAREYFYTVDRAGELHHDGTVLSDRAFLRQFFRRLQRDPMDRHADYPFVSVCAGECNFVRAEATVVVFRRLQVEQLEYSAGLVVPFEPGELRVAPDGALYHPAPVGDYGVLRPVLAMAMADRVRETSSGFEFVTHERSWPIRRL